MQKASRQGGLCRSGLVGPDEPLGADQAATSSMAVSNALLMGGRFMIIG